MYVSGLDHNRWNNTIGTAYAQRGRGMYSHTYKVNKDLKIMSAAKSGEEYTRFLLENKKIANQSIKELEKVLPEAYRKNMTEHEKNVPGITASLNIAFQTKAGKDFVDRIKKQGYEGIQDYHGMNVAKDPLIIFDPDSHLTKKKSTYLTPYMINFNASNSNVNAYPQTMRNAIRADREKFKKKR